MSPRGALYVVQNTLTLPQKLHATCQRVRQSKDSFEHIQFFAGLIFLFLANNFKWLFTRVFTDSNGEYADMILNSWD